jgi:hypothetical protein
LGLGLGDVRPGHFTDIEAVAGLAQLLLQHFHVAALQFEQGAVAEQIHIGLGGVHQDRLLGDAERFPSRGRTRFGLTHPVRSLISVVKGLGSRDADALRRIVQPGAGIGDRRRAAQYTGSGHLRHSVGILLSHRRRRRHSRLVAGQRLRHGFVRLPHHRPLRVELRIALVGVYQRVVERIRLRRQCCRDEHHRRRAN